MRLLRRILKAIFSSVFLATVTVVGAPIAFAATILAGLIFLPLPAAIPVPKVVATVEPSVLYDRYGHQIGTLASFDKSLPFTDAEVPSDLKEAVIADEDRNFFHESGIDLRGMVRALVADLRNRAPVQGGSTITQQYVKLAYTGSQRTIYRKIREAILASQLAREASKEEILYHYLTLIYLGDGNYGAAAAANTYFRIPLSKLDASQAATLAGLIPAPSLRDPERNLAGAELARQLVLKKMYQQHYLSAAAYAAALALRLALAGTPGAVPGKATIVYPDVTPATSYPDFVDYVTRWLQQNLPPSVLEAGGLRVQTTLDPAAENEMQQVAAATLDGASDTVDMGMAAIEPQTGFVDALYAGRGFNTAAGGKFEHVNLALGGCQFPPRAATVATAATCWNGSMITGGGSGRQPGSSFKPFTLATAFEQGIPPASSWPAPYVYPIPGCTVLAGQQSSSCQIHNDEGDTGVGGSLSLAAATAYSINTVYAQVAEKVGCPNVAATASRLGVETAYYSTPPFYYCASYALGEVGVSPLDMASAYGVFAAHGQRAAPTPILEIVDGAGKVLVDNIHHPPKTIPAIPANVADNVTNVLQGVIQYGTAAATAKLGRPAAGKTGTTNNNTDAWFVGYTPTLSTAVWMGDPYSDAVPVGYSAACPKGCVTGHFLGGGAATYYGLYGGEWPAITWKEFMGLDLASVPATPFSAPAPIYTPEEASALQAASHPNTTAVVEPGPPGYVAPTPLGGPYSYPAVPPVAPAPPATTVPSTTTTTTLPGVPTTVPEGTTTTSLAFGGG